MTPTDKRYDWAEFSSDDSSDDDSVGVPWKAAAAKIGKPAARSKVANNGKTGFKIPRKKKDHVKKGAVGQPTQVKFGQGYHRNKGRHFLPSPKGKPMVLSRRLSRKIVKASPLRSPIVACKLDFNKLKKQKHSAQVGSRPGWIGEGGAEGGTK